MRSDITSQTVPAIGVSRRFRSALRALVGPAPLRSRLGLPGRRHDDEPAESTAPLARTAFYLIVAGATATLVSLLFNVGPGRDGVAVAAVATAAYPLAAICVAAYDRLTLQQLQWISACTIVLVTLGLYYGGPDSGYYRMFYIWIALFTAYHFGPRGAAIQIAAMAAGYAVVVGVIDVPAAPVAWLLTTTTLLVIGVITSTLRSRIGAQLRAAQEQNELLIEADRLKDQFLATVSHELRTPLTSIRGYLELVREDDHGDLSPQQRGFLDVIDRNSDRLLRQVTDLLLVAQIEAGTVSIDRRPLDVRIVVEAAIDRHAAASATHGVALTVETLPVPSVTGDSARIGQVLDVLLSNALKFTPEGGQAWVRVRARASAVEIEVTDTGPGIRSSDRERIFDRFYRVDGVTDQAVPGTGIGLTIARGIVEAHGGSVSCTSVEGAGATFSVVLPAGGDA